ncbi:sigma-54-dependent transcriptional regulator [Devosia nitrariae]|uniref:Sigma-54-dependent Fis family transcriptional regulator n=1 Tax=Devosia nitrariae TaxID=2071872 RepID=A0ABQ5W490_9HYPH|nr:sigma-54 dependent transcriptional regulator [Devosia nitrariae]GLQ54750.1 sigma-54-dependent Fis family transcriptional regulator [Devosia nitrariae]
MTDRGVIAFIDDEPELCEAASEWLSVSGFAVETFSDSGEALRRIDPRQCDCVVTDLRMPGAGGLDVLARMQKADRDLPVILLTGHGDVQMAVEAMQAGAYDFIEKPYDAERLVAVLDRAVERRRLRGEVHRLQSALGGEAALEDRLVGISPAIVDVRRRIAQLADVDVDLLIRGETGTGKEVVARALHDLGRRAKGNFVAINCAAIPETIFESEIFGHERGAFTGAGAERIGKFEFALGGTIFLDEIESMPLALQAKVLRAIQERSIERLGSNRAIPLDVRFIAASKLDLKAESDAGRFRADLYFRLGTVEIDLPPLRERREDVALLFTLFAAEAARRFSREAPEFGHALLADLRAAPWPGNVRELKAAADRAVLGLAENVASTASGIERGEGTLAEKVAHFEAELIAEALRTANGSTAEAAEILGLPRRTLNEKIARYSLRDMAETGR